MLDTDQLRSFLAIVDTGSFTRAAERVHKTQSAVSMHMRRLEEQLGCALFVKQGRGARLTERGREADRIRPPNDAGRGGRDGRAVAQGAQGRVRLGIPDDYAESFLAEILTRFNHRHPLVEISVVCEASVELAAQVAAARLNWRWSRPERSSRGGGRDPSASSCCARSRWSGRPPSGSGPRKGLQYRWRWPAASASGTSSGRRPRRPRRERRGLFFSKNFTAIGSIVRAGLAATILPVSWSVPGLRVLGRTEGLPELPLTRMGLIHAPGRPTEEAVALAEAIRGTIDIPGAPGRLSGRADQFTLGDD